MAEQRGIKMINPKLQDKVVLITGANHGIGAATAKAFADQGAKVFITFYRELTDYNQQALEQAKAAGIGSDALYYARQQQDADWLVQAIGAAGGTAVAHEMDLADPANILRLFDRCESSLGPVDVLVNNHTFCVLGTFDPAQVSTEQGKARFISAAMIDRHFAINTRAYALLMAEYAQRSIKRAAGWGRIINISTDAAHAHPWNVSYGEHGLGRAILRIRKNISCCSRRVRDSPRPLASHGLAESSVSSYIFTDPQRNRAAALCQRGSAYSGRDG
jgi:3-oxoacyl-[acyl-carrier protein] reductase